ncbi:hypothetical protein MSG28_015658 [Choristoneura fumiferana]|uniref:Uncharacterized protein n=1 Tax=Choristoneura fumiferana TaxID=7141 RepID=A0ACC0KBH0_CHOFU|nr:hypothetical protein MSG28_015658 [Choristoneura fumiferana]
MSIIAVEGIPTKWSLTQVVKSSARVIAGKFEALNFVSGPGKMQKTCYLRLSEMLDPLQVVERLNSSGIQKLKIRALIPDEVPDIPLASKPKQIPMKLARSLRIPWEESPHQVLIVTHSELMMELQYKFTGLFNLSRRTPGHSLLYTIAQAIHLVGANSSSSGLWSPLENFSPQTTLFERLRVIMSSNADAASSCFKLSRAYRRLHPHFGDFQLILSTLHGLQDAKGAPRTHVTEEDLMVVNTSPFTIDNIPYDRIQSATSKYSLSITKKVLDHIRNLDVKEGGDSQEDAARRRVRKELQNLAQHLPSIIRQVIQKHLSPEKSPFYRMRIYGEPAIPGKEHTAPFARRFRAVRLTRSDRMYNLLKMNVSADQYSNIMRHDGTVIDGAKLVIRASDIPLYKTPPKLHREMAALYNAEHDVEEYPDDEDMDSETEE